VLWLFAAWGMAKVSPSGGAHSRVFVTLVALACGLGGCGTTAHEPPSSKVVPEAGEGWSAEPIQPLPLEVDVDAALAELGERLFRSPILSDDGRVACSSCHAADRGMASSSALCRAPGRPVTATNSTTLFNVRYFYKLTWKGKYDALETHLDALIESPNVMASSWANVTRRLQAAPAWRAQFQAVFPDGVQKNNVRRALLEYERSLVTPNAPFDRFLRGETAALSAGAKRGYESFKEYGCASCHQGMAVGGNMRQVFGVMEQYFADPQTAADDYVFRVPSLRNVALTPPYLHDGSVPTLEAAVMVMARHQLGRELPPSDVDEIVLFLKSLTGEYRGKPL
jgi:cytochrome c peroxidase